MTRAEKQQLRHDIATKIADSLGDILKHDDDHEQAVDLIAQALTDRSILARVKDLVGA